jgi:Uma2 family endonuclease
MPATLELIRATTSAAPSEQRILLHHVSWDTYRRLADDLGDRRSVRLAYNRGVLEIMSPGETHETFKSFLRKVIEKAAEELDIPHVALASTTWERPLAERGIEADECYFFAPEKVDDVCQRPGDVAERLAPDLVLEIDLRRSAVDRPEIYSTLGVPEVWRFNGKTLEIDRLTPAGSYETVAESQFLPLSAAEIVPWITGPQPDDTAWSRRFRQWLRTVVLPRRPG